MYWYEPLTRSDAGRFFARRTGSVLAQPLWPASRRSNLRYLEADQAAAAPYVNSPLRPARWPWRRRGEEARRTTRISPDLRALLDAAIAEYRADED